MANREPYGPFSVTVVQIKSAEYSTWAALTETAAAAASGTPAAGASATAESGAAAQPGSSSSSSSSLSEGDSSSDYSDVAGMSGGAIFALVGVGLIYVLQAVQIL